MSASFSTVILTTSSRRSGVSVPRFFFVNCLCGTGGQKKLRPTRIRDYTMRKIVIGLLSLIVLSSVFSACKKDGEGKDGDPGIYVGIVGFNDKITEYSVGHGKRQKKLRLLNSGTQKEFESFIDELEVSNGTKLYHAVRVAIDNMQAASLPEDLRSVSIITFTDGLDLGSYGDSEYDSGDEYVRAICNRIFTEKVHNLPMNAYCIGMKGDDVGDEEKFRSDLQKLSSSSENAMLVSNMSEVNEKFKQIASSLYKENVLQSLALKIPLPEKNQQLRFTFDVSGNSSVDASNSQIHIDFQFDSKSNPEIKYIIYEGITGSRTTIMGTTKDKYWYSYDFGGISLSVGGTVPTDNVKEWYLDSNGQWQINSEFDGGANVEVSTEVSSAAVILVLDCSSSLGSEVFNMKQAAKDFIATLRGASLEGGSSSPVQSSNTLNGHEFVDLGLPSGLRWATCNIGAITPEGYGDYFAWGETTPKETYTCETYIYAEGTTWNNPRLTKYCFNADYGNNGFTDALTTLEASDDAATANWGVGWRMPTYDEMVELKNNCTVMWTTRNGVNGCLFTGSNGNTIFMPAAGGRYDDGALVDATVFGFYSSSTIDLSDTYRALILRFYSGYCGKGSAHRDSGNPVRAVCSSRN